MKIKNINAEINQLIRAGNKAPYEAIRYKYLNEIKGILKDKIIVSYYCNLNNPEDIIEDDIKSFINLLDEDHSKGIVLIITSNGGDLTTVERIMTFIQDKYNNNIEIIIPQIAMSAATVMALSAKKIYMPEYACLGPIDPQIRFNNNVLSGHAIIMTFQKAMADLNNNINVQY